MKVLTSDDIGRLIRETPYGKHFKVGSDRERRTALTLAKGAGKTVHSRPSKGGFKIYVLE